MAVDDTAVQLNLLSAMLTNLGYEVRSFVSGKLALEAARDDPPELVLLDVKMPEMSGYDVCRQMKSEPGLCDIPVIFISASGDTSDKVEAFDSGGVDYVTKPFRLAEVHARVETHLKLKRLQQELEEQVRERTRQLAEARDRLAILDRAKSDFLHLISHELRTPLSGVLGIAEKLIQRHPEDPATIRLADTYQGAKKNLLAIVEDALLLTEINVSDGPELGGVVSLAEIAEEASSIAAEAAMARGVHLAPPPSTTAEICGDRILLARAFASLLETAVKLSPEGETVTWEVDDRSSGVSVVIEGHGSTIPEGALGLVFETLSISEPITPGGEFGLKPVVAERIISLFGASIAVANIDPPGVQFKVFFPGETS